MTTANAPLPPALAQLAQAALAAQAICHSRPAQADAIPVIHQAQQQAHDMSVQFIVPGCSNQRSLKDCAHLQTNPQLRQQTAQLLRPIMRESLAQQTEPLDDSALEKTIVQAFERAATWGVRQTDAHMNFVILWLLLGPDFDKQGAIKQYLSLPAPGLDASVRINSLMSEFKFLLGRVPAGGEH